MRGGLGRVAIHGMKTLLHLAELVKRRNALEEEFTAIIGRPAAIGHIGEYIASKIFSIALVESASQKNIDGYFQEGPLAKRSVNIKWYAKLEWLLDITADALPDFYLVMAGPKSAALTSRGKVRPWLIDSVYCFNASALVTALQPSRVKIGIATSVNQSLWKSAEIYPKPTNSDLMLSDMQREMLGLFK
jgi:hypothetical protein